MKTLFFRRSSQLSAYSCQPKTTSDTPSSLCQRSNASGSSPPANSASPDLGPNDAERHSCRGGVSGCSCNRESRSVRTSRVSRWSEPFSAPRRSRGCCATAAAARDNALCALRGGGGERNRTDDLLLAKQALSQLSYTPRLWRQRRQSPRRRQRRSCAAGARSVRTSLISPERRWSLCLHRAAPAVAAQPLSRRPHERRCASFGGGPGRI
jgi:hypothetical protein